jgi:hypothetical protein
MFERNLHRRGTIAAITQRPMAAGHLGEWIAARVFEIKLGHSAVVGLLPSAHNGPAWGPPFQAPVQRRR